MKYLKFFLLTSLLSCATSQNNRTIANKDSINNNQVLICEKDGIIEKAEMLNISYAKNEQGITFNENLKEEDLLKQVTNRLVEVSPLVGEMFAHLYLKVTEEKNFNLGKFVFPKPKVKQLYRICKNPTQIPELRIIAEQDSTFKIDEIVYDKFNDINKMSLILGEVLNRLNVFSAKRENFYRYQSTYESTVLTENDLNHLNSLLLSEQKSTKLKELLEAFDLHLVRNKIKQAAVEIKNRYNSASSFESAQQALVNQTIDLGHGVTKTLSIKQTDLEPHELAKLKNDGIPVDPSVVFWGIPGSFIVTSAIGGISNGVGAIMFQKSISAAASTVMLGVGVGIGTAITVYGIISNTIYKRKLKLLQQSYDLINGSKENHRFFNRAYKKFKRKISGVSNIEYAQRVIDLAYKNSFTNEKGKFVNFRKMKKIIIESFKVTKALK